MTSRRTMTRRLARLEERIGGGRRADADAFLRYQQHTRSCLAANLTDRPEPPPLPDEVMRAAERFVDGMYTDADVRQARERFNAMLDETGKRLDS